MHAAEHAPQSTCASQNGLVLPLQTGAFVQIGCEAEAGTWHDDAVYASFGLEHQIFRFSKLVFPVMAATGPKGEARWIFRCDFAPLYDQMKREDKDVLEYKKDSAGHSINGNNPYFDWYKNLGSRVYYIGSVPIIEAYAGYQTGMHTLKIGRLKNLIGFCDNEIFWEDDAKFAPMQHWLCHDLLNGAIYTGRYAWFQLDTGILSGNNPMKGYARYLEGIQSPQTKANNTPTFSGNVRIHYGEWLGKQTEGFAFAGIQENTIGSTWEDCLQDGKRHSRAIAFGGIFGMQFSDLWLTGFRVFGQYTRYTSGLKADSAQNKGHPRFLKINQKGFFVGLSCVFWKDLTISGAFEQFDRFDFNVYEKSNFSQNTLLRPGAKQYSRILNVRYNLTSFAYMEGAYHSIRNPIQWVSDIWDTKGDKRFKLTLGIRCPL